MTKRIFRSIMLAVCAVLLASFVIILGCLYEYFGSVQENQLKDELNLAAAALEADGENCFESLDSQSYRLTWVASDGTVLYDTQVDAKTLENHIDRSEIQSALTNGTGESTRYSSTLLQKTTYCAKKLSDGSVLRISVSRATAGVLALGMVQPILIVLILALALSGLLAGRMSKRIVEPLNRLDLENPLDNDAYDELSPLLGRLSRQQQEIKSQLNSLRRQRDEFAQITNSMKEGLVLLDANDAVLSINHAAKALFNADETCAGRNFLTLDRSPDMNAAIQRSKQSCSGELRAERNGRVYQFDVSRVKSGDEEIGTVILSFDVTAQEEAERSRREFTANVSHELRTPLQGIIGSAELLENGMAKPEDAPRFIGHIRDEAARMVTLIEDIIRLSQLDEGEEMPRESVDLLDIAREAAQSLKDAAEQRNVTVSVDGGGAVITGVRRLLYEIVYNLCDNAIRYNVDGGSVNIRVESDADSACIAVTDTGIGIPPEHQDRVFERFYRVDKSHSRASGGTGLGLSIVKQRLSRICLNLREGVR